MYFRLLIFLANFSILVQSVCRMAFTIFPWNSSASFDMVIRVNPSDRGGNPVVYKFINEVSLLFVLYLEIVPWKYSA